MPDETSDDRAVTGPDSLPRVQEFPKMLYHPDGRRQIVQSQDEADALGKGWGPVPAEAPPKAAE